MIAFTLGFLTCAAIVGALAMWRPWDEPKQSQSDPSPKQDFRHGKARPGSTTSGRGGQ